MSAQRYTHILLTRFNLQYLQDDTLGIQPEWLEQRCALFETYCLPSIQHQTCQDFTWILIVDERTPEPYLSRILAYQERMNQLSVICVPFYPETEALYREIGAKYGNKDTILISSRVDNDDRLAEDYMMQVQKLAHEGKRGVLSFPEGKQTFIQDNISYRIRFVNNHFLSRIETQDFYTVLEFNHREAGLYGVQLIPTDRPMWEEIVHSSNLINDYMPIYHYYIQSWQDFADLSKRWFRFHINRLRRLFKRLFIAPDQR